jgi:hypothetical protein
VVIHLVEGFQEVITIFGFLDFQSGLVDSWTLGACLFLDYGDNILKEPNILFKFLLTIITCNILQQQNNSADIKQNGLKSLQTSILSSHIVLED